MKGKVRVVRSTKTAKQTTTGMQGTDKCLTDRRKSQKKDSFKGLYLCTHYLYSGLLIERVRRS